MDSKKERKKEACKDTNSKKQGHEDTNIESTIRQKRKQRRPRLTICFNFIAQHQIGCRIGVSNNIISHYKTGMSATPPNKISILAPKRKQIRHRFARKLVTPKLATRTMSASKIPTTAKPLLLQCFNTTGGSLGNLAVLHRTIRLRFGYGFEPCDVNGPRNVKNTNPAKHRPVFSPTSACW